MKLQSTVAVATVIGAIGILDPISAYSQSPDAINQLDTLKRRQQAEHLLREQELEGGLAPELYVGEMRDVGPQSILETDQRHRWFEAGADSQFFFTSNMFLEEDNPGTDLTDTTLFVNTVHLAASTPAIEVGNGLLGARAGFQHSWFNYGLGDSTDGLNDFDFDAQTVMAEARYRINGWLFEAGIEWTRLLDHSPDYFDYDKFYSEVVPRWGLSRHFYWSESKVFTVSYQGHYRVTDSTGSLVSDANDRTDQALYVNYSHALTPHIVIQPYYRFQYSYFTQADDRTDLFHTVGLTLSYIFNEYFSVRAFASYERRDSDDPLQADYEKIDGGVGVNAFLRF